MVKMNRKKIIENLSMSLVGVRVVVGKITIVVGLSSMAPLFY